MRKFLALLMVGCIAGCSEKIKHEGIVLDKETGLPLENAHIEIYMGTQHLDTLKTKVYTDKNGHFKIDEARDAKTLFVLSKDGYIDLVKQLPAIDTIKLESVLQN